MNKKKFATLAAAAGLTTQYSGAEKKMYIGGDDKKAKTFIRMCCLKGANYYPFAIGQV